MTIATMAQLFDLLQDKYGSPYYTNPEKSLFLNRAQVEFVKSYLPDGEKDGNNIELSEDALSDLEPLIYALPAMRMSTLGIISKSTVQTALTAAIAGGIMWRRLNTGWTLGGDTRPVKWTRHNDYYEFKANAFKNPSIKNPRFYVTASNYTFDPISTSANIYFTVLKYPVTVDIDGVISSDLPDHTHNKIVALALEFAGIGSRDENLAQLLQLKSDK